MLNHEYLPTSIVLHTHLRYVDLTSYDPLDRPDSNPLTTLYTYLLFSVSVSVDQEAVRACSMPETGPSTPISGGKLETNQRTAQRLSA